MGTPLQDHVKEFHEGMTSRGFLDSEHAIHHSFHPELDHEHNFDTGFSTLRENAIFNDRRKS